MSKLKIAANPFFWTTAAFHSPSESGEMQEVKVRVKLAYKNDTDYQDLLYKQGPQQEPGTSDKFVATQVLIGWGDDICDASDKPLPYNDANRDALFNEHKPIATAIVKAWIAGQMGAAPGN